MKDIYTAPSATVFTMTADTALANDVAFDDLLGDSFTKKEDNTSIVPSDIDLPLRD